MSATSSKEASPQPSNDASDSVHRKTSFSTEKTPEDVPADNKDVEAPSGEQDGDEPPLPEESAPPLPNEAPPAEVEDDGWAPLWDDSAQAFYFFNRFTNVSQWNNPRVPEATQPAPPGVGSYDRTGQATGEQLATKPVAGGYDPAIHGDYDPDADYAKTQEAYDNTIPAAPGTDPSQMYAATGAFNRFTGKWQNKDLNPENFNDENKSRRQMNAFFDVDAAANSHDGKSLKAERSGKKLSKAELKAFKEKRKEKKEEKRRAWLKD